MRKIFIALSVLIILLGHQEIAAAQTFADVKRGDWYYDYVEQLAKEGVFEKKAEFKPNEPLNRAEMIKIVIAAIDQNLKNNKLPTRPTFKDVPKEAWFYNHVEVAIQRGIISGYQDKNGKSTGYFGPGDWVNRATVIKVIVAAFKLPVTKDNTSPFSDVKGADWVLPYARSALANSVIDEKKNGRFNGNDKVTRAELAKMIVKAKNPVKRKIIPKKNTTGEVKKPVTNAQRQTPNAEQVVSEVIINGKTLNQNDLDGLRAAYGVAPKPGKYWYDSVSGLYGNQGQGALGFMRAGHQNLGQVAANASNGNTGIFFNGRNLTQQEGAILNAMIGVAVAPGRYWLDGNGFAGYEGDPNPVINLFALAAANSYSGSGGGGGDKFWSSRFSAGNSNADNSQGYVSVPGYGPVDYGF